MGRPSDRAYAPHADATLQTITVATTSRHARLAPRPVRCARYSGIHSREDRRRLAERGRRADARGARPDEPHRHGAPLPLPPARAHAHPRSPSSTVLRRVAQETHPRARACRRHTRRGPRAPADRARRPRTACCGPAAQRSRGRADDRHAPRVRRAARRRGEQHQ